MVDKNKLLVHLISLVIMGDEVVVHLRATGNAQILKQNKFKISDKEKFQTVIDYLRKILKYKGTEPLFLYVNSAFQTSSNASMWTPNS